jgi:hypothetical protein
MSQNCDQCVLIPPKASPSRIGIGPSWFFGVILRLRRAFISLTLSLRKASPSPSNTGLLKLLANFNYCGGASVSVHFFNSFPQKSITLAFERMAAGAFGEF